MSEVERILNEWYERESIRTEVTIDTSVADSEEARLLGVSRGTLLFDTHWISHAHERPIEVCRVIYRTDMTRFKVEAKSRDS